MKFTALAVLVAAATADAPDPTLATSATGVRTGPAHSGTVGVTCSHTTCAWDAVNNHVVVTHPVSNGDTVWQSSTEANGYYAHCGLAVGADVTLSTSCVCRCHSDATALPGGALGAAGAVSGGSVLVNEDTDYDTHYDQSTATNHAATDMSHASTLANQVDGSYDQAIVQHTGMNDNMAHGADGVDPGTNGQNALDGHVI